MKDIQTIEKGLAESWQTLSRQHWRCGAQKQFEAQRVVPMLAQIHRLDELADEIDRLCAAAEAAAASVREPDEDEEQEERDTWQND